MIIINLRSKKVLRSCLLLTILMFSYKSFSCVLNNPTRHTNSDGSLGGLVNVDAKVTPSAYLNVNAKVCDRAVVESNVQIFDSATIKDNAWIRSYTEVRGQSVVGGNAVTLGSRASKVVIRDSAQILGGAKILSGSVISGNSVIEGSVEIQDVKASFSAKICGTYKIRNIEVFDDLFCTDGEGESNGKLKLSNYSEDAFNLFNSVLSFKLEGFKFHKNRSIFQILINDELVSSENLLVNASNLKVLNADQLKDGFNLVTFLGRDEHDKIISQNFAFHIGTLSHEIIVPNMAKATKIEINYKVGQQQYKAPFRILHNKIILDGLPNSLSLDEITIQGVSSSSFIQERFTVTSLPSEVNMTELPKFIDNYPSYENFFERWDVSDPDFVSVLEEDGTRKIQIFESPTSRIEVSKTFNLSEQQTGLSNGFSFPSANNFVLLAGPRVELFYISKAERRIESIVVEKGLSQNFPSHVNFSFHKSWPGEVTLVIRVTSIDGLNNYQAAVEGEEGEVQNVSISFEPKNFGSRNLQTRPTTVKPGQPEPVPETTVITKEDCKEEVYDFGKQTDFHEILTPAPLDLEYFSVGKLNTLEKFVTTNRIHGTIKVSGIEKDKIKDIELIGMQSTSEIFKQTWSTCAKEGLVIEDPEKPESKKYIFKAQNNLVKFAFAVPFSSLSQEVILRNSGSTISFKIKLKYLQGTTEKIIETNVKGIYPILISPLISSSQTTPGGIDTYDSNQRNYTRTGGDKWALPAYSEKIASLVSLNSRWNVNDLAKLNGGVFRPHTGHRNGRDVDIKYDPVLGMNHNFFCNHTDEQWKSSLQQIEQFLITSLPQYKNIETIFISRDGSPSSSKLRCGDAEDDDDENPKFQKKFDPKYVERRFNYTCIGFEDETFKYGRYIDLGNNSGMAGTLLAHHGGHHDHLHVEYNNLVVENNALVVRSRMPVYPPATMDIAHFKYTIDLKKSEFRVEPLVEFQERYSSSMILARIQDNKDFTNPNNVAIFGKWRPGNFDSKWDAEFRPFGNKYLYLVEVNRESGACIGIKNPVELDFGSEPESLVKVLKFHALKGSKSAFLKSTSP